MKNGILILADHTSNLVQNFNRYTGDNHWQEEYKSIDDAKKALNDAMSQLKNLNWDHLCAISENNRQELTTHQQNVILCYAKLKRALLEVYKEIFNAMKEL